MRLFRVILVGMIFTVFSTGAVAADWICVESGPAQKSMCYVSWVRFDGDSVAVKLHDPAGESDGCNYVTFSLNTGPNGPQSLEEVRAAESILLAALTGEEEARAVFRLVPPDRFTDPLLGRLADLVSVEGVELDPLQIDASIAKAKLIALRERREELGLDGDSAMRLLVELLRRRLQRLAREGRGRLVAKSGDEHELIRRNDQLRRAVVELGARPPQHPDEVVEILDRFESGPSSEGRPEPQVG